MSFTLHPDLQRDGIEIGKFTLCRVLLINDSNYPWFVLVPAKDGLRDTIDLSHEDYALLWQESRDFSQGIMDAFKGEKLNIAALGNMTPQLHIHHIVRFTDDPAWPGPIWGKIPLKPYTDNRIQSIKGSLMKVSITGFQAK